MARAEGNGNRKRLASMMAAALILLGLGLFGWQRIAAALEVAADPPAPKVGLLATETPTATPSPTATAVPTGWLGPQTIHGTVAMAGSLAPIPGAFVGGEAYGPQGGYRPLPVATTATDGTYALNTGFGLYDTDTVTIQVSANGYAANQANATGLEIDAGTAVDVLLQPLAPTPTPTATPSGMLHVTIYLQGRPLAPDASWIVPLELSLNGSAPMAVMSSASGAFQIAVEPGTYDLCLRGENTLANERAGLVLGPGLNLVHMGTLRSGDLNGDEVIDILDFSLFRTRFGGPDGAADLNNSGFVDIVDFSVFRANFGQSGPVVLTGEG